MNFSNYDKAKEIVKARSINHPLDNTISGNISRNNAIDKVAKQLDAGVSPSSVFVPSSKYIKGTDK